MYLIEFILLAYFSYATLYSLGLSVAALSYKTLNPSPARSLRKVAVLIPAYKEDAVICDVAAQALTQTYPPDFYDVVVIADSLKAQTIQKLSQLPIHVIEVSFEKSTKVKALNHAMEVLGDGYDCAVVLDADNIMARDFIWKMNNLFDMGYRAIQAQRAPKNENTPMALLDGLSETINNFIYRQGNTALKLSSSISGSGMMFDYEMYKSVMKSMDSIGGFDRELELLLLKRGIPVYYAKNITVYDEKVANHGVFEHQRKRWISSHFFYLKKYFSDGWKQLFKGNFSYFNSAVLRNIQLPRLLNLGLLSTIFLMSLIFASQMTVHPFIWAVLLTANILAMAFAIPARYYNRDLWKSLVLVPGLFVKMFLLLFKLKNANKSFIHTPHGK